MSIVHIEDMDLDDLTNCSLHKLHKLVSAYETIIDEDEYETPLEPEELNHLAMAEQQSWNNAHHAWANGYAS